MDFFAIITAVNAFDAIFSAKASTYVNANIYFLIKFLRWDFLGQIHLPCLCSTKTLTS